MIFFKIAYRNVTKNWRHSLSALLSLSASFVSLVLFDGYIDDIKQMYDDSFRHRQMLGDVIIEKPMIHEKAGSAEPWKFWITKTEQQQIENFLKKHNSIVSTRVRSLNLQGLISNGRQSAIFLGRGFDIVEGEKVRGPGWSWNTTLGKPLHLADGDAKILLGQGLAKKLGCTWDMTKRKPTQNGGYEAVERPFECVRKDLQLSAMTGDAQLNAADVEVVGLMDAGYKDIDDRFITTSLTVAQALMNTDDITYYAVELKNRSEASEFIKLFNSEIKTATPSLAAMPWIEHPVGETFLKTMDMMAIFRNFVVVVILLISTLSVFNTLIKIIKERTKEIGTLRSLGFTAKQVQKIFLIETVLLTILGTGLGLIAAVVLTVALNSIHILYKAGLLSEPVLFHINFSPAAYVVAFGILLGVSLFACLLSTHESLTKKVIENLNHV